MNANESSLTYPFTAFAFSIICAYSYVLMIGRGGCPGQSENAMKCLKLLFIAPIILFSSPFSISAQVQPPRQPYRGTETQRKIYSKPEHQAKAKEFNRLLEQLKKEKGQGQDAFLSMRDPRRPQPAPNKYTSLLIVNGNHYQIHRRLLSSKPSHRASVLASPASLVGPISYGPAYGSFMFQNAINQLWQWDGPALPWSGMAGSNYLISSGPFYIPYEIALQNRLTVTTVTDSYGNQLISVYDNGTGFSHEYQVISRLDSSPSPGTAGPTHGLGNYVSTYNGQIIGTNTSSFPGVFVPSPASPATFGYSGNLDTFGPSGSGHTPISPAGPPAIPSFAPVGEVLAPPP